LFYLQNEYTETKASENLIVAIKQNKYNQISSHPNNKAILLFDNKFSICFDIIITIEKTELYFVSRRKL